MGKEISVGTIISINVHKATKASYKIRVRKWRDVAWYWCLLLGHKQLCLVGQKATNCQNLTRLSLVLTFSDEILKYIISPQTHKKRIKPQLKSVLGVNLWIFAVSFLLN